MNAHICVFKDVSYVEVERHREMIACVEYYVIWDITYAELCEYIANLPHFIKILFQFM